MEVQSLFQHVSNPMDGGAWQAAVHGLARSQTRLSNFTSTFHFHALEREMANHSSVLSWRIPGMGEPGGLPSMGSHRVDMTEATQQQQQKVDIFLTFYLFLSMVKYTHVIISVITYFMNFICLVFSISVSELSIFKPNNEYTHYSILSEGSSEKATCKL